jgi:hypothetical protein
MSVMKDDGGYFDKNRDWWLDDFGFFPYFTLAREARKAKRSALTIKYIGFTPK